MYAISQAPLYPGPYRVSNLQTKTENATLANHEGYYRCPLLYVAEYELKVSALGFAEIVQTGIRLSVGPACPGAVDLGPGDYQQEVREFHPRVIEDGIPFQLAYQLQKLRSEAVHRARRSDDSLNAKDNLRWKTHPTTREPVPTTAPTLLRSAKLESNVE
jgi:hypothetical protein